MKVDHYLKAFSSDEHLGHKLERYHARKKVFLNTQADEQIRKCLSMRTQLVNDAHLLILVLGMTRRDVNVSLPKVKVLIEVPK